MSANSENIDEKIVSLSVEDADFRKSLEKDEKALNQFDETLDEVTSKDTQNFLKLMSTRFGEMTGTVAELKGQLAQVSKNTEELAKKHKILGGIYLDVKKSIKESIETTAKDIKNLSDSITGFGKASSSAGMKKYEEKTSAVQTIIAATRKDGETLEEAMARVEPTIAKLNTYTDETSYSFSSMISNIGKFTSNGIALEEAEQAMEGIANWAAVSGVSINDANRAFANMSQAIAAGSMRLQDWKSFQLLNMSTVEFKQTAIETAKELGKLDSTFHVVGASAKKDAVSVQNFDETLSMDWLDKEVLMATLKKYTDTATEFGRTAFKAAQEAKTFSDVMDSLSDAVASSWMNLYEKIFGNYAEAKEFFSNMANALIDLSAKFSEFRLTVVDTWRDSGGREAMIKALRNIYNIINGIVDTVGKMFAMIGLTPENIGKFFADIFKGFADWTQGIVDHFGFADYFAEEEEEVEKTAEKAVETVEKTGQAVIQTTKQVESATKKKNVTLPDWMKELAEQKNMGVDAKQVLGWKKENRDLWYEYFEEKVGINADRYKKLADLYNEMPKALQDVISYHNGNAQTDISGWTKENQILWKKYWAAFELPAEVKKTVDEVKKKSEAIVEAVDNTSKNIKEAAEEVDKSNRELNKSVDVSNLPNWMQELTQNTKWNEDSKRVYKWRKQNRDAWYEYYQEAYGINAERYKKLADLYNQMPQALQDVLDHHGGNANTDTSKWTTRNQQLWKEYWEAYSLPMYQEQQIAQVTATQEELTEKANEAVEKAGEEGESEEFKAIKVRVGSTYNWLKEQVANVKKVAANVWADLKKVFKDWTLSGSVIGEVFGAIGGFFASGWEKFQGWITPITDSINKNLEPFKQSLESFFTMDVSGIEGGALERLKARMAAFGSTWEFIKEKLKNVWNKIKPITDSFKPMLTSIQTLFTFDDSKIEGSNWDKFKARMVAAFGDGSGFKEALSSAWEAIKNWYKETIEVHFEGIKSFFTEKIPAFFEEIGSAISDFFTEGFDVTSIFTGLPGLIFKIFFSGNEEKKETQNETEQAKKDVEKTVEEVIQPAWYEGIFASIEKFVDDFVAFTERIEKKLEPITSKIDIGAILDKGFKGIAAFSALKSLKGIGTGMAGLKDFTKLFGGTGEGSFFDTITKFGNAISGGMQGFGQGFGSGFGSQAANGENAKSFVETIHDWVEAFKGKDIKDAFSFNLIKKEESKSFSKSLMQIGIGIGAIAASVYLLSKIDPQALQNILLPLGEVLGALAVFSIIVNKLGGDGETFKNAGLGIILMAAGMLILTIAIKRIAAMDPENLTKALITVIPLMLVMAASVRLAQKANVDKKPPFIGLAVGLFIMASAVKKLGKLDWEVLLKGVGSSILLMLAMAVAMRIAQKTAGKDKKIPTANFVSFGIGLWLIGSSVKKLGKLQPEVLLKGIFGVISIMLAMSIAMRIAQKDKDHKNGNFLAFAISVGILAMAVGTLGHMKTGTLVKGGLALVALMAGMAAMMHFSKDAKIGGIAAAALAIAGLMVVFALAIKMVAGIDPNTIVSFAVGMTAIIVAMTVLMAAMSKIGILGSLKALGGIAIFAVGIGALATGLGYLADVFPDLKKYLGKGTEIAKMIAEFTAELFTGGFGTIADNLGSMKEGITSFFDAFSGFTPQMGDGIVNLMGAMAGISGFSWSEQILQFLGGEASSTVFTKSLGEMATGIVDFYEKTKSIKDIDSFNGVANAAGLLAAAADNLPAEGGVLQDWLGYKDLDKFADTLPKLGAGMSAFSMAVTTIKNVDDITAVANAAVALAKTNDNIPRTGGKLQEWIGEPNLERFSVDLPLLGAGMTAFSASVAGVNSIKVKEVADAALSLAKVNSNIPRKGGKLQAWIGEESLTRFSIDLPMLGTGMKLFSDSVKDVQSTKVKEVADAALSLAKVNTNIPRTGGKLQEWLGQKSLETFGNDLKPLGEGLRVFSNEVKYVEPVKITDIATAAGALATLSNKLPKRDGILQDWLGEKDLGLFGDDVGRVGKGIGEFAKVINENKIDQTLVDNAVKAMDIIKAFQITLPENSFIEQLFGRNELTTFGDNLGKLGDGFGKFISSLHKNDAEDAKFNAEEVGAAIDSLKLIDELQKKLPEEGIFSSDFWLGKQKSLGTFGDNIKKLGEGLAVYKSAISGFSTAQSTQITEALKSLNVLSSDMEGTSIFTTEWWTGKKSLGDFGDELVTLAGKLMNFSDALKDYDVDKTTAATTALERLATSYDVFKQLTSGDTSLIESLFTNMGSDTFVNAVTMGDRVVDNIVYGVNKDPAKVPDAVNKIFSLSLKAGERRMNEFYNLGVHMIDGMAQGMADTSHIAVETSGNIMKAELHAMKNVALIQSPSKVTYGYGQNLMYGLMNGMTDIAPYAERTSEDAMSSFMSPLQDAIRQDLINGIDDQPTIRPILDLSDLEMGMYDVNRMFGGTYTLGANGYVPTRATRMGMDITGNSDRGGADNDISAMTATLSARIDNLAETMTNLKIVLDTGRLVGGIAPQMDQELGSRASLRGRRN